ncbi:M23 family metallopeptidase [Aestuariivirga litoralis]|uniref:M23 family metallopeptidase n=1 Tax=Aestuariivirga litoralis TaxID=2650924 RepID=UPI0018C7B48E|nr:M23 family metallopeptidase [Aestuariivirga litoralis]MBG1232672.1 M23 family metallopeptidase [Aestuariivirga litoralis]
MTKIRQKRELIRKLDDGRLVPVEREFDPIDLDTGFLNDDSQHRWLLTTCIAGVAGTILMGGLLLGIFGRNASPLPANASVPKHGSFWNSSNPAADKEVLAERDLKGGYSYPEVSQGELPYSKENTKVLTAEIEPDFDSGNNITTITKTPPPEPVDETFALAEGSTLSQELASRGVPNAAADALVAAIEPLLPTKQIKAGTKFDVTFDRQIDFYGREVTFPVVLSFDQPNKGTIEVNVDEDGQFTASIDKPAEPDQPKVAVKPAVTQFHTVSQVGASLSATAQDQKIPDYIVSEFIHAFSYDVDFQRQVEASDTFEVFYGNPLSGSSAKRKVLHMARLTINGQTRSFYRFTTADGLTDYFDENGHSASSTLIRTPVSGAHLTSGFGVRVHPLLGYSKMHTGVDFGAPSGTPIRAAGDGTIDRVGRENGYGNTIIISHNKNLETLYAHMSRFAAGIRDGVHVNQGQVIGYVGATGRATGPHLHFEVRINDRPVNPTAVRSTGGRQLAGKDFASFKANRDKVLAMMQNAPSAVDVADASKQ